jgi:hypothetical protein
MNTKRFFMENVGFLKWAKLSKDVLDELTYGNDVEEAFVSPDVHSLHILWVEKTALRGDKLQHEIADYDEDVMPIDFLDNEVGDDAQGPISWTDDPYEAMSDFEEVLPGEIRVISLEDLGIMT